MQTFEIKDFTITYTPMTEKRLNDFRVISTHSSLWADKVNAELHRRSGGALKIADVIHITDNMNDLYTLLFNDNITITKTAELPQQETDTMNKITLKRLSQNQVTILTQSDLETEVVGHSQIAIPVEGALETLQALEAEQENTKVKRVVQQLIKKVAAATGVDLGTKTRSRLPNTLPTNIVKVKTSKTQQRILAYVHKRYLSSLIHHEGGTFTAINTDHRDAAVVHLADLNDHKLSARSCATLIRKLNELEVTAPVQVTNDEFAEILDSAPAPVASTTIADLFGEEVAAELETAPVVDADQGDLFEPAPADEFDDILGTKPAPVLGGKEVTQEEYDAAMSTPAELGLVKLGNDFVTQEEYDVAMAEDARNREERKRAYDAEMEKAYHDDQTSAFEPERQLGLSELLATLNGDSDAEPTQADLDAIEAEMSDDEIDAQWEADLQLRELKAKHRDPNSPMHEATSVDEYWNILERVQREDEIANAAGVEFVSLDEAELDGDNGDDDGHDFGCPDERFPDDEITLALTAEYWGAAVGAIVKSLEDIGVEYGDDEVTLTRELAGMIEQRLYDIASGSQSSRFGGEIDWDFEDEVDEELAAWSAAAKY